MILDTKKRRMWVGFCLSAVGTGALAYWAVNTGSCSSLSIDVALGLMLGLFAWKTYKAGLELVTKCCGHE